MRCLSLEPSDGVLASSIITTNTNVVIPRGQKVDVYDFSDDKTFCQEWEITPAE